MWRERKLKECKEVLQKIEQERQRCLSIHFLPTHKVVYICNALFLSLKIPTFLQSCAISRQVWAEALPHMFGRLFFGQEEGQIINYHLALRYHPLLSAASHAHNLNGVAVCSIGHKFCKQPCLRQWLRTNPICPICRAPMDPTSVRKTTDRANRGIKKQKIEYYLVFCCAFLLLLVFLWVSYSLLHCTTWHIILQMFWNEDNEGRIRGRDYRTHIMPFELNMLHRRYDNGSLTLPPELANEPARVESTSSGKEVTHATQGLYG